MPPVLRRHPYLVAALGLAAAAALALAIDLGGDVAGWDRQSAEPVAPWMTVGYIARSRGLDPREIDRIAGLPLPQGRPLTLAEIARDRGVPAAEIVAAVEAALAGIDGGAP